MVVAEQHVCVALENISFCVKQLSREPNGKEDVYTPRTPDSRDLFSSFVRPTRASCVCVIDQDYNQMSVYHVQIKRLTHNLRTQRRQRVVEHVHRQQETQTCGQMFPAYNRACKRK